MCQALFLFKLQVRGSPSSALELRIPIHSALLHSDKVMLTVERLHGFSDSTQGEAFVHRINEGRGPIAFIRHTRHLHQFPSCQRSFTTHQPGTATVKSSHLHIGRRMHCPLAPQFLPTSVAMPKHDLQCFGLHHTTCVIYLCRVLACKHVQYRSDFGESDNAGYCPYNVGGRRGG